MLVGTRVEVDISRCKDEEDQGKMKDFVASDGKRVTERWSARRSI